MVYSFDIQCEKKNQVIRMNQFLFDSSMQQSNAHIRILYGQQFQLNEQHFYPAVIYYISFFNQLSDILSPFTFIFDILIFIRQTINLYYMQNSLTNYMQSYYLIVIIFMKLYTYIFLFIIILQVHTQLNFYTINTTSCYSRCATCSLLPSNCTTCVSNFLLVNNQCILNSKESILDQNLFPLSLTPNATITVGNWTNNTKNIINCSYTQNGSSAIFYFYSINTTITFNRSYDFNSAASHDYFSILFTIAQIGWGPNDFVTLTLNSQTLNITTAQTPSPLIVNCGNPSTAVLNIYFPLNDTATKISFSLSSNLSASAQFGITNYVVRYGNCDPTCGTCFGANFDNCLSCRGYLKLNQLNHTCFGCDASFYQSNNACMKCDITCINCNGGGPNNCTQCNTDLYTLVNNTCVLQDPYYSTIFQFNATKFTQANWSLSTSSINSKQISICGQYSFLGGYQIGTATTIFSKTFYKLNLHFKVSILMHIILIDSSSTSISVSYTVDNVTGTSSTVTSSKTNQCGGSNPQSLNLVIIPNLDHTSTNLTFSLKSLMSINSFIGIRNFILLTHQCQNGCLECDPINPQTCIKCYKNLILQNDTNICTGCPARFYVSRNGTKCSICSVWCQNCTGRSSSQCTSCDPPLILWNNQCIQNSSYGIYSIYLNKNSKSINDDRLWNFYPNLQSYGKDQCGNASILGSSTILYKRLLIKRIFDNLPDHTEITLYFNFYQIDTYSNSSVVFSFNGVKVPYQINNFQDNLCGNQSTDSVSKIIYTKPHTSSTFEFIINVNQIAKVGINNLIIMLKSCQVCKNQLTAQLTYMPIYSIDKNKKSIQIWIDFNHNVQNQTTLQSNMVMSLGIQPVLSRMLDNINTTVKFDIIKMTPTSYFFNIPLNFSIRNEKLYVQFIEPYLVIFSQGLEMKPLVNGELIIDIVRYDYFSDFQIKRTLKNLYNFNLGFAAAVLYLSICSFAFGLSYIFEQFITLIQIIFIHIFICGQILPPTLKIPLQALTQIQFLNYFTPNTRISLQKSILPINFIQKSPHIFQQYYPDTNFIRAIYPIVFLNVLYLIIYAVIRLSTTYLESVKTHKKINYYLKYIEEIYNRPLNFFDAFFRLEYMTVVWACVLQFLSIQTNIPYFTGINTFICVIFFIFVLIYPAAIMYYLIQQQKFMQDTSFAYLYKDILYNKYRSQIFSQNPYPFLSILVRFYKIFFICVSVAASVKYNTPLGCLIFMVLMHLLETFFLLLFRIYTDEYLLAFKIIENSILVILQILYFIIYGQGNKMDINRYLQLGKACQSFIMMLLIIAGLRSVYLLYKTFNRFIDDKNQFLIKILRTNPMNEAEQQQILKNKGKFINESSNHVSQLEENSKLGSNLNFNKNRHNTNYSINNAQMPSIDRFVEDKN